jgi:hypothetical protein
MSLKALQISTSDIAGSDAAATVLILDRDKLRRETGPSYAITVKLTVQEKNALQAIRDRGLAKLQARLDKANADVTADPNAPVDLGAPIEGEAP